MKKILIIDDDPDFVDAVTNLMGAKGYKVDSAPDGEKGLKAAMDNPPDLLILDVMMTRKTEGFDLARDFQKDEKTKTIPIIMVTGIRKELNLPFGFEPDEDWLPVKAVSGKSL